MSDQTEDYTDLREQDLLESYEQAILEAVENK